MSDKARLLTTAAGLLPDFKPWTPEQSATVAFHMSQAEEAGVTPERWFMDQYVYSYNSNDWVKVDAR